MYNESREKSVAYWPFLDSDLGDINPVASHPPPRTSSVRRDLPSGKQSKMDMDMSSTVSCNTSVSFQNAAIR